MVRLIVPKAPEPAAPKVRRQPRPRAEIVAALAAKEARKAERALRAKQRAEAEAVRSAQKKLVDEARAARLKIVVDATLKDVDRTIGRIASRIPQTSGRWDQERDAERKRIKSRRRALRERQSIARAEPLAVREEIDWLAANDRPVIEIPDEPAPGIAGMLGAVSEVRRHTEPALEQPPETWTSAWVMKRITDAYLALARLPGSDRPAGFGRAWPAYLTEFADEVGRNSTNAGRKTTVIKVATIEDIERMEAVFAWPRLYLGDQPKACRALFKWASGKTIAADQRALAISFGMAPSTFRRFRLRAAALVSRRLNKAGQNPF